MKATPVTRLPVVGVVGSGTHRYADRATPLGTWLATEGVHLLTGGGEGVMRAVGESFAGERDRTGLVVGVLPGADPEHDEPEPRGYPNPFVELAIATHLTLRGDRGDEVLSRNHLIVLSADVIVALPGGAGTSSEVRLARRYERPIIAWLSNPAQIPDLPADVHVAASLEDVKAFVRARIVEGRSPVTA